MYTSVMTPGRLQVELKQSKPFPSLATEAALGLQRTAAIIEHAAHEALRPFGITATQYNVLRILRGSAATGLCGREIGERMITRVPDVPRLLERMEEAGLISRVRDTEDRRHVIARITDEGLRILDAASPALDAIERRFFGGVAPEALQELIDTLDIVRER